MLQLFKNKEQEKKFISNYQNPFQSDRVYEIVFRIGKPLFGDKIKYRSVIYFKAGNTRGSHDIEALSFTEIVEQTDLFVKSL